MIEHSEYVMVMMGSALRIYDIWLDGECSKRFWIGIGVELAAVHRVQQMEWTLDSELFFDLHAAEWMDSDLFEYQHSERGQGAKEVVPITLWLRAHRVHSDHNRQFAFSVHLDVAALPRHIAAVHCECAVYWEFGRRHKWQVLLDPLWMSQSVPCSDLKMIPTAKWKRRQSVRCKIGVKVLAVRRRSNLKLNVDSNIDPDSNLRSDSVSDSVHPPPLNLPQPTGPDDLKPEQSTDPKLVNVDTPPPPKLSAKDIVSAVEQRETTKLLQIFEDLMERTKEKEQEVEAMRWSMKHYIQRSEDLQQELAQNRLFLEQLHRGSVHRDVDLNVSVPHSDDHKESEHKRQWVRDDGDAIDDGARRHLNVHRLGIGDGVQLSDTLSDGFDAALGFQVQSTSGPSMSIQNSRSREIEGDDDAAKVTESAMKGVHGEDDVVGVIYDALSVTEDEDVEESHSDTERRRIRALEEDLGDVYVSPRYRQRAMHRNDGHTDHRGHHHVVSPVTMGTDLTMTYRQRTPTADRHRIGRGLVEEDLSRTMASTNSTEITYLRPEPSHYVFTAPPMEDTPTMRRTLRRHGMASEPILDAMAFVDCDGVNVDVERRRSLRSQRGRHLSADVFSSGNSPETTTPTVHFGDGGVPGPKTEDEHVATHNMAVPNSGYLVSTTKSVSSAHSKSQHTEPPTTDSDSGIDDEDSQNAQSPFLYHPSGSGQDTLRSVADDDGQSDEMSKVIRAAVLYDAGKWALNQSADEKTGFTESSFATRTVVRNVGRRKASTQRVESISTFDDVGTHLAERKRKRKRVQQSSGWMQSERVQHERARRPPSPQHKVNVVASSLPDGWTSTVTASGLTMFMNHKLKIAQFKHPETTMQRTRTGTKALKSASFDTMNTVRETTAGSSMQHRKQRNAHKMRKKKHRRRGFK